MAISKEIIAELKQKLIEEKKRLEKELDAIGKPTENPGDYETEFDDIGRDKEDNAIEVDEYSDNVAVESNLERQLKEVSEALKKMEDGAYGICENCNQEIDIERLRAYPAAKACIRCA